MARFDFSRLRPEVGAGGYAEDDDGIAFYQRIDALLRPDMNVLDFGAGRSAATDGGAPEEKIRASYPYRLRYMKGRVAKITGVDIDPQVLDNPTLDEAFLLKPGQPYPFPDKSFDLIFADWVVEHIEDAAFFAAEIGRVLKDGGWFCARTPNRWSYIAIGARLFTGSAENFLLRRLQPWRKDQDAFPKFYRMNTIGALSSAFPDARWKNCTYRFNAAPRYHANNTLLFRATEAYQKLAPNFLATTLLIFMQKGQAPEE